MRYVSAPLTASCIALLPLTIIACITSVVHYCLAFNRTVNLVGKAKVYIVSMTFAFCIFGRVVLTEDPVIHRFEYEFKLLEKLVDYGGSITALKAELKEMKQKIEEQSSHSVSQTYTRWGRSSCPDGAAVVYDGFAAGSQHSHSGAAANYICLQRNPKWDNHIKNPSTNYAVVYGAEYETGGSIWNNLYQQDVPCAVCRVPRSNILMVPGRNDCHVNDTLEYSGYLMSGRHTHTAATEFVCVDRTAEAAPCSSSASQDGKLFYFVHAECGSLKCPPYEKGKDLTCAVCSF